MRRRRAPGREIALLLRLLDQGFDHHAWHGPTLAGALRGVTRRQALWRPARGRHNIWELVLHTAYWKYAVRRRLAGGVQGAFPRAGSNWPGLPGLTEDRQWRADLALLKEQHRGLREAVAVLPPAAFAKRGGRGRWTNAEMVHGVAMHDLYHAGQIQLLKRLQRSA
ncbi:MAG TPA: DinB family protein [Gemmatimonadales bacterium]